jgi:hypothetical protein
MSAVSVAVNRGRTSEKFKSIKNGKATVTQTNVSVIQLIIYHGPDRPSPGDS